MDWPWTSRNGGAGRNLVDILKKEMTNGFGDKLCKEDERRVNLFIFKVKVFHNDL